MMDRPGILKLEFQNYRTVHLKEIDMYIWILVNNKGIKEADIDFSLPKGELQQILQSNQVSRKTKK